MFYMNIIESSSDEDLDDDSELMMATAMLLHEHSSRPVHRALSRGAANVKRNREKGHYQLYWDYFQPTKPIHDAQKFRLHYRMSRKLFTGILNELRAYDGYFTCKPNATGKLGFTSYQKCSAAIRMLVYGVVGDLVDK
jgi:hypothetical protein